MAPPNVIIQDHGGYLVVGVDRGHGEGFEFAASYPTHSGAFYQEARDQGRAEAWAKAEARRAEILAPYGDTP